MREKNFKTVLYGGPLLFLHVFPCIAHISLHLFPKNRKTLSRMLQPKKPSNAIVPQKKDTAARHKENPHILTQAEFPFSNPIQWHY